MSQTKRVFSIAPGRDGNGNVIAFLNMTEDTPDDFGVITRKRGFIPIEPVKAEAVKQAAEEGKITFMFGPANKQQPGLFELIYLGAAEPVAAPVADGTLEHK